MVRQLRLTTLHARNIPCSAGGWLSPTRLTLPCLINLSGLTSGVGAKCTLFFRAPLLGRVGSASRSRFSADGRASLSIALAAPKVGLGAGAGEQSRHN